MTRLLFVDAKWPRPTVDASSMDAAQLVGELVEMGFDVDFAALFPAEAGGHRDAPIDLAGARPVPAADADALLAFIERHGRDYQVAVAAWTRVAQRVIPALRAANPGMFIVFDTSDVNHVREYRHARVSGNANILRRALAMKRAEFDAVGAADLTLAISDADARVLREGAPDARVEIITLYAEPRATPVPGPEGRSGALYLGNYMAWHNVDAVTHLARDVVPHIEAAGSRLPIILAGAGRHELVDQLASERIEVIGFVPELVPELDRRRMFVAPLRVGSGVKGKLLTALAAGLPVVATPIAAEGIPVVDGQSALVATTPEDFAAACVRLESDDGLWRRLSAGAQALIGDHFSRAVVREQCRTVFGPLLTLGRSAGSVTVAR